MPESAPQQQPPAQPQVAPAAPAAPAIITIDEFKRAQLVIGEIKEVADHPNASKLLLVKVDLGTEVRQLVAGIKGHYEPAQLVGRKVVVIANLAPAVIRGQKSEGMILAAEGLGGSPILLGVDKPAANGAKVR